MNITNAYLRAPTLPRLPARKAGRVARAIDALLTWRERSRSRRLLGTLDEHMLKDMGLDRVAVNRESDKPFWRP